MTQVGVNRHKMAHEDREKYIIVDVKQGAKKVAQNDDSTRLLPGFSGNKSIYLVLVEDISVTAKKRAYVSLRVDYEIGGIKFNGYEVKYSSRNKIKTHNDAHDNAIDKDDHVEIYYTGQRVISVRNVSYIPSSKK